MIRSRLFYFYFYFINDDKIKIEFLLLLHNQHTSNTSNQGWLTLIPTLPTPNLISLPMNTIASCSKMRTEQLPSRKRGTL